MNKKLLWIKLFSLFAWLPVVSPVTFAQEDDEEVFELSAFEVEASEDEGYMATTTLAGSRVRSNLRDLGASIAVVTEEFMQDTGATDGQSLLQFVGNVEVGGVLGNFSDVNLDNASTNSTRINPQNSQRVRGLVSATLTRDYFQTNIPFDGYNTSRVTVNRGPNSILFGLGSPGGVINNTTNRAQIGSEFGEISVRFDHNSGHRETLDINKTLIEDRLAVRVSVLNENVKYRQEPAFEQDQRFYIAWDAVLLENEGSDVLGKTRFRGSFEHGDINSNPPDVVPPTDRFSSWWNGVGDQAYLNQLLQVPGVTLAEINNGAVTYEQALAAINAGLATIPEGMTAEEYAAVEGQFIPRTVIDRFKRGDAASGNGGMDYVQNYVPFFLYPAVNYNTVNTTEPGWNSPELAGIQGIMGRWRPNGFPTQDLRWTQAATAGAGFRPKSLNNREIFDYHKNLFSGNTNWIDTSFDIKQFVIEQELFDGRAGFEIAWDRQSRDRERFTPFSGGDNKSISIDITTHQAPGDSNFDGIADRTPNENLGRPVIDNEGDRRTEEFHDQETFRATIFGTLDFGDMVEGTFGKILGRHTLTGLYEDRTNDFWTTTYGGAWWADSSKWPGDGAISNGLADNFRRQVQSQVYLGDSGLGLSSADQLRLDGPINVSFPKPGDVYGIWYFDNAGSVDAGVQAPWRVIEYINGANMGKTNLESKAASLQSHFFDGLIVGMYAVRNDKQTVYQRLQQTADYGDPSNPASGGRPLRLDLPGINEIDGSFNTALLELEDSPASVDEDDTTTWSVVAKYPEQWLGELPLGMDISAHYYEAESFQPAGISNNVLNQQLASPFGSTEEYGATISFFDNRLSVRVNWFETVNANARTGGMNGQLAQIVGRFNFFLTRIADAEDSGLQLFVDGYDPETGTRTPGTDAELFPSTSPSNRQRLSGTDADLIPGVNSYDAYYDWIIGLIPDKVQSVYNFRVNRLEGGTVNIESTPIRGLNSTQDYVAEGMEIDITGRITDSLSVSLNVAQQETVTSNTGPVALPLAFEIEEIIYQNFPGLDYGPWAIRDSPFQVEQGTFGTRYNAVTREMRLQAGKDNNVSQEQREWRINLTTRYDFLEGGLKGLSVGGSLRYQDEIAGGYPNILVEDVVLPDVQNPWFGPDELDGDMFVRYRRKLTDKLDWTVQLNARNLYRKHGSKDIPIAFDPDGTVSLVRIPVEQQFFLTNTFSF